ncbi:MAG: NAD-dependent epimerase/dehydratase family protein [Candidatus Latescibacteria bacterium]|nr:NAD-dependent epimerase/dehydratase family protein [Candidatus Latescibacterota bacterium]MBT4136867.1 NAD-dependent epimerase/dehydratase family protein [Candidatus Latescibacterota bacterium]
MNILILGGDGFIGSHVVDKVVGLGHTVTVFDRFSYRVSKHLEHLRGKLNFVSGEFANRDVLKHVLENQDIVYHFICTTNPASSWNDPFIEVEQNLKDSIQFFELASECGVRKIIFPSSGGTIYGPQSGRIAEDTLPQPFSPYGITKLATEHFLNYFREHANIASDIYRIGNAYGPRQPVNNPQGVIALWMKHILEGSEIQVYGDRQTLRDYIYVEDIAQLMTHSLHDTDSSETYNLGTGIGVSILDLLNVFIDTIDQPFQYKVHPRRSFDNTSVILDSSRLMAFFSGFKFQSLKEKIIDTWCYVKENYTPPQKP